MQKKLAMAAALIWAFAGASIGGAQPFSTLPQSLEGAWNVTIGVQGSTLCTAAAVFTRDGNVIAEPCSGLLGPGYGAWLRTGDREFAGTFVGNIYNLSTGQVIGKYKVKSRGTLQTDRETFTGVFQTETFDLGGGLASTVTGSLAARRIQVEALP
jgi:hypothetical protein